MKTFAKYKANCSELNDLMSREQGVNPPTEKDLDEFLKILQKSSIDITEPQKARLQQFVTRALNYDNYSLSATFKSAIYRQYAYYKYGVSKVSLGGKMPLQLEKGEVAEPDAIKLLSSIDGVQYEKNEKLYSNAYFKGIPDILLKEGDDIIGVKEVKVSFDLPSFLERIDGDSIKDDRWEVMGYMDIFNLRQAEICYCLVDMPSIMKEAKLKEAHDRMILLGATIRHIKNRLKQIERSMVYDFLPIEQRVKRFTVERKPYFVAQARGRVKKARKALAELDAKFKNSLILPENNPTSQESTF